MECVRIIRTFHPLIESSSFHSIVNALFYILHELSSTLYSIKVFANHFIK